MYETITLNNGVKMPILGLGVFQLKDGKEVINAVKTALQNGYRSIDTAYAYQNATMKLKTRQQHCIKGSMNKRQFTLNNTLISGRRKTRRSIHRKLCRINT